MVTLIKLPLKFWKKDSNAKEASKPARKKKAKVNKPKDRNMQFDLFAQLTYMASISTARIPRSELFEYACKLPYSSTPYFRQVHFLAKHVGIDYAEACRMIAERTEVEEIRGFLLRLSGALVSGEDEEKFLKREAGVIADNFSNRYDRDIESLKKWTDAYVTLVVAAGLIVIVSVISMMIYDVGTSIIVGMSLTMVLVTCLGAWILYISAPHEVKTRVKGPTSKPQILASKLFVMLAPLAVAVGALMFLADISLGYILIVTAAIILPPGFIMHRNDGKLNKIDYDIPTVVRVLGGVTSAIGTTVTEALGQIDKRSMGVLMPEMNRLRYRLDAGIDPKACWDRFGDETGSELVERTVGMFWDALSLGADAGKAGEASSVFAARIAHLRATRTMVATTFRWLILPLHGAMVGLLLFIPQIMTLFTEMIQESAASLSGNASSSIPNSSVPIGELFAFGNVNLVLIHGLVTFVVLTLTIADAYAPKAADGGSNLKTVYNLSQMMFFTGVLMVVIPIFARSIFQSITDV